MAAAKLLIATHSFACEVDGEEYLVRKGATRVRANHPLVKGREQLFEPAAPGPDLEPPAKAPRRRRPKGGG
jgi:hypothetical protein